MIEDYCRSQTNDKATYTWETITTVGVSQTNVKATYTWETITTVGVSQTNV
jgi:hypothetical protein